MTSTMTRERLDETLSWYATSRPKEARFAGQEFTLVPEPASWFLKLGLAAVLVPNFVLGAVLIVIGPSQPDTPPWVLPLVGLGLISIVLIIGTAFAYAKQPALTFNLENGDISKTRFGRRKLATNFSAVGAMRRRVRIHRSESGSRSSWNVYLLQFNVLRPGKDKPKWKTYWSTPSDAEASDIQMVLTALFEYFEGRRSGSAVEET